MNHDRMKQAPVPLVRFIWRAYFKTSLIPLLIVEVALISLYFISNAFSNHENVDALRALAEKEVSQAAHREANGINRQLESVNQATDFLRNQSALVLKFPERFKPDDPGRFDYAPGGAYYTTRDTGGGALFYSGVVPIGPSQRDKALQTAGLDSALKGITDSFPLIVQAYLNTHDSLNRIYPYFEVLSQYPAKMDIPSYNFYYEADAQHNPDRKVVWTDVYIDPAGQGWMTSCIAPVYRGDFLEGVVGTDVTVNTIVRDVLDLKIPWGGYGLLISRSGNIIAIPKAGEIDWGVKEFTEHEYTSAIQKDTFKPVEFNIFQRGSNTSLAEKIRTHDSGLTQAHLNGKQIVSWATIPETGWKLLITVPEHNIYAPAQSLSARLNTLAWLMVGGMLVFYFIFFILLYRRAREMSEFISQPLALIDTMVAGVANGHYLQAAPAFPVRELKHTAEGIVSMGSQLNSARISRDLAEEALNVRTSQLQSVFDLSPDAFISIDENHRVVQVNPAFIRLTLSAPEEWLGMTATQFWKKLGDMSTNREALPPQDVTQFRIELAKPRRHLLQCEVRNVHREDRTLTGMAVYLRDITHEVELDRMKSEFLASAAHELRTPLTSVMGYAELLLSGRFSAERQADALNIILRQARWLVNMINELLDLARIESRAGMDFTIISQPLEPVVTETIAGIPVPAGRTPVVIGNMEDALVDIDSEKFKTVLNNVVTNAYKYSSSGEVSLHLVRKVEHQTPWIGLRLTDHGIGMSEEEVAHVFDRFWRADTTGNIPGTGLGMSIANEIMRLLGGSIQIESTPEVGTTVTLWLPESVDDDDI